MASEEDVSLSLEWSLSGEHILDKFKKKILADVLKYSLDVN